jgi:DNA polymerase-3 subunit gamma/tau
MAYVALYRKWRPQCFKDVVGQVHIVRILKNAIKSGRIVHAYLFSGPRGTGKTSSAKILAKTVNCLAPVDGEACNECSSCRLINEGNSMDVIEIDAASNRGIDEIRDLREKVKYAPVESKYKVYIIDEVHMLTTEAFNALLKTLEEPPKHVIFILATTEAHKIPQTVLSRCQKFDFKRIGYKDIVSRLNIIIEVNNLDISERAVQIIAQKAEGSMRDALSLLDQCVSFTDKGITEEIVAAVLGTVNIEFLHNMAQAIADGDLIIILKGVQDLINEGKDLQQFLNDLLEYFRNILLTKLSHDDIPDIPDYFLNRIKEQSALFSNHRIFDIIEAMSEANGVMRYSTKQRITLEICLIKAAGLKEESKEPTSGTVERVAYQKSVDDKINKEKDKIEDAQVKSPGVPMEIGMIKELWKMVLEGVRKQRPSTYAYLVEGEPTEIEQGKIKLLYKPNFQLHMQNLNQPVHKSLVEKILLTVYKEKLSIQGYLESDEEKKKDLVEEARELFGDSVLEIKE